MVVCFLLFQAFTDRLSGYIFTGLTSADERNWKPYVNLNNSLTIEKHIMFSPYRMLHATKTNEAWNLFPKVRMFFILGKSKIIFVSPFL